MTSDTSMKKTITFLRESLDNASSSSSFSELFYSSIHSGKVLLLQLSKFQMPPTLAFLKLLANGADIIAIALYSVFLSKVNLKKFYSTVILMKRASNPKHAYINTQDQPAVYGMPDRWFCGYGHICL